MHRHGTLVSGGFLSSHSLLFRAIFVPLLPHAHVYFILFPLRIFLHAKLWLDIWFSLNKLIKYFVFITACRGLSFRYPEIKSERECEVWGLVNIFQAPSAAALSTAATTTTPPPFVIIIIIIINHCRYYYFQRVEK